MVDLGLGRGVLLDQSGVAWQLGLGVPESRLLHLYLRLRLLELRLVLSLLDGEQPFVHAGADRRTDVPFRYPLGGDAHPEITQERTFAQFSRLFEAYGLANRIRTRATIRPALLDGTLFA